MQFKQINNLSSVQIGDIITHELVRDLKEICEVVQVRGSAVIFIYNKSDCALTQFTIKQFGIDPIHVNKKYYALDIPGIKSIQRPINLCKKCEICKVWRIGR